MQGRKTKVDWDAVQRERHEGKSVRELSEKYGVSDASIYTRTRGNSTMRTAKAAAANGNGKAKAIVTSSAPQPPDNLRGEFAAVPIEKELASELADTLQKALPILRVMGYEIVKRQAAT